MRLLLKDLKVSQIAKWRRVIDKTSLERMSYNLDTDEHKITEMNAPY